MYCPYCKAKNTKVIDKRDNIETNATRRRRQCAKCNKRFTSYERVEKVLLNVIKRDGKIQEFDREKIRRGILKATKKRNIPEDVVSDLIDDIEQELMAREDTSIRSVDIGEMVLKGLIDIDKLGALLFAAVYKDFGNLEDVENELKRLSKGK